MFNVFFFDTIASYRFSSVCFTLKHYYFTNVIGNYGIVFARNNKFFISSKSLYLCHPQTTQRTRLSYLHLIEIAS